MEMPDGTNIGLAFGEVSKLSQDTINQLIAYMENIGKMLWKHSTQSISPHTKSSWQSLHSPLRQVYGKILVDSTRVFQTAKST